jgi:alkylhydroperoxidase/carboxymuconolactone decarboxylase family protein YurZ
MDKAIYDKGMAVRRAVLGDEYVDAAIKSADDFNRPLQEMLNEYCWGAVWGREGLPRKTRSMLNLAMISVLNRPHELRAHIRGERRNAGRNQRDLPAGHDLRRRSGRCRLVPDRARGVRRVGQEGLTRAKRTIA